MAGRLEEEGTRALILRPAATSRSGSTARPSPLPPTSFSTPRRTLTLCEALLDLGVHHVHFHHRINVPNQVLNLIADLKLSYDCTVHDYHAICPRINLINGTGVYWGNERARLSAVPGKERQPSREKQRHRTVVRRVTAPGRPAPAKWSFPTPRSASAWPGTFRASTSSSAGTSSNRLCARPVQATFFPGETLRVALIGVLAPLSLDIVLALRARCPARNLNIRFHFIGSPVHPHVLSLANVACTGAYQEEAVFDLLARERCHSAFFPSLWPETYSYNLSIALMASRRLSHSTSGPKWCGSAKWASATRSR